MIILLELPIHNYLPQEMGRLRSRRPSLRTASQLTDTNFSIHTDCTSSWDSFQDAAIHFGAFLQLKGLLQGGNENYGTIEVSELYNQFDNQYQPVYQTQLTRPELLSTLKKFRVIKQIRGKQQSPNNLRITKYPQPAQVRAPEVVSRHRVYVDQTRVLRDRLVPTNIINESCCRLCNVSFLNQENKLEHVDSDIHKFRLQYREKRSSFKDKVGEARIDVVGMEEKNEVILRVDETSTITVKVTFNAPYVVANIYKIFQLVDIETNSTTFHDNAPIELKVTAKFSDPGAYIYPLVAKIMPAKICLLKNLIFHVESELMDELAPSSPYIHNEDVIREMEGPIIPGEQLPKRENKLLKKVRLGEHKISSRYNKLVLHKFDVYEIMSAEDEGFFYKVVGLLCGSKTYREALREVSLTKSPYIDPLNEETYSERYGILLDLEELQQQKQVKDYDRSQQTLQQAGSKFILNVPDLSEGRPSVTRGDKIHARLENDENIIYEGIIHEIREQGLLLGFHREFSQKYNRQKSSGLKPRVDVRFTVNRFPYLNMHRALSIMGKHKAYNIVFPKQMTNHCSVTPLPVRQWFNPLIETNPEQQKAVKQIMSWSSGEAPYLVFGPPGTGKTVTLVETISQVWFATQTKAVKQLVCAPSNTACNNIAESLISTLPPTAKILRFFSLSTEVTNIPENLQTHSNFDQMSRSFCLPTMDELMTNHIIVVTIVTAGRLVSGGAEGRFDFVYIDECGQASEPEALIAIAGILTTKKGSNVGQLVLAGDPQQLGPILSSQPAKDFGLGMSLLERLMNNNSLYQKKNDSNYDNNYLTKLVKNFRSHSAILEIPNQLFYDKELEIKGSPDIINKAIGWKVLPNKNFPLIFHGVQGLDERESNSPSYFNRHEIDVVYTYIKQLFNLGLPNNYKVQADDIGVITPYRKQVQKFRKVFEKLSWDIKVGSVEEFQGSEKLIIFISSVRSSMALVDEDYRFKLGFLKNPKRFNVSITRAKALLIVVGNPNILRHDKQWNKLLKYCRDNGAVKGITFPVDDPPEHQQEHISG